jgi:pentatricopeptide repeat protein
MKRLRYKKPLEVSLTGMIASSMDGGHIDNCISIFEHMKAHCVPNIGTINTMLKVYSRSDLFSEAKELFEDIKGVDHSGTTIIPDGYTYVQCLRYLLVHSNGNTLSMFTRRCLSLGIS